MKLLAAIPLIALPSLALAGDYTATLSGDATDVCTVSFSTEAESVDGVQPLESGDITAFSCTIDGLALTLSDLQYPLGGDYRVVGGEVTEFDLQTNTGRQLQFGTYEVGEIDNFWQVFGHGALLNTAGNAVTVAPDAPTGGPELIGSVTEDGGTTDPVNFNTTVPAGTNRIALACIANRDYPTFDINSVTIGGQSGVRQTVIGNAQNSPGLFIYRWLEADLAAAGSGVQPVVIDPNAARFISSNIVYFQNVNQTTPLGAEVSAEGVDGTITATIASATGRQVFTCAGVHDQGIDYTGVENGDGVEIGRYFADQLTAMTGLADGAASVTPSWPATTFDRWAIITTEVLP